MNFHYLTTTKHSKFKQTNLYINLEISGSIIRDILGILLLFIINLILLFKIKIIMISKLSLLTNNNNTNNNKISTTESMNNSNNISTNIRSSLPLTRSKFEQTKRKQTINILTTCFICLIGRLPIAIVFLIKNLNFDNYQLLRSREMIRFSKWNSIQTKLYNLCCKDFQQYC